MFVVKRMLLMRGEIKNNLSFWDRVASVAIERVLLERGPLKGGSAVTSCQACRASCQCFTCNTGKVLLNLP